MADQDLTPGEIGRSLRRIEETLHRIEESVGKHETAIEVLKEGRSIAVWITNGLWTLFLVVAEWFLHRK